MARIMEGPPRFADLKGPRFNTRKFRKKIVTKELFKEWKKTNPGITFDQFKYIWKMIAQEIQNTVITEPDGVMLPNGIGKVYTAYVKMKEPGIDWKTSKEHDVLVTYENYHSYGKPGKIVYNPCSKYKLSTCTMWNFKAITPFKEKVSQAFRERPEIYKNTAQKQYHGHPSSRTSDLTTNESSKAD